MNNSTKATDGRTEAWILFSADKPVLHKEGLPGLTACGNYAFSDLFGAVTVGKAKPDAPICEGCANA